MRFATLLATVLVAAVVLVAAPSLSAPVLAQEGGLGKVEFPNSGAPESQADFIRGLLLLHSFEYDDARAAFKAASDRDPDFAMAYWGEAMTLNHPVWQQQDTEEALEVLAGLGATPAERYAKAGSEREAAYLRALDALYIGPDEKNDRDFIYMEAMRQLKASYPDDLEAASFYALSILGSCHEGRDIPRYMRSAAVVEEVYERNPDHPGALHYLIHSYDDPIHAPLGLRAARLYSKVAARTGHALHMPSHIFVAMGMWDDVEALNEESWLAENARQERRGLGAEAKGWHARLWQHYAFLQQGRYDEALQVIRETEPDAEMPLSGRARGSLAQMRSAYVVATHDWDEAASLEDASELGGGNLANALLGTSIAALHGGDPETAEKALAKLQEDIGDSEADERNASSHIVALEIESLLAASQGEIERAYELVGKAMQIEDSRPFAFGPPVPTLPAHELMGDLLRGHGKPAEAIAHYQKALERTPGRAITLLGLARAADAAGESGAARLAYAQLQEAWHNADADLADLAEVRRGNATGDPDGASH